MIDERQEELAALAALDLLEGAEKAQFDGEMARNPELKRRYEELREASASLAHTAPVQEPPDGLKGRVLASAATRRQLPPPDPVEPGKVIPFPLIVAWVAAACFAVAAAWSLQAFLAARTHNSALELENRLANDQVSMLRNKLDAESLIHSHEVAALKEANNLAQLKISTLVALNGNSADATAVAVWNPKSQEGVIRASLPAAGADQDYELWVIPEGKGAAPIPAGLVRGSAANGTGEAVFRAEKPVAAVAKFAVSLERKGGAPAPAGKIVLLSQ